MSYELFIPFVYCVKKSSTFDFWMIIIKYKVTKEIGGITFRSLGTCQ